jgi:pimeloyl-ACP methyl ester carboxylesterase
MRLVTCFKTADVAGLKVFYREAGDPSKPIMVLLHGFPSSSYQFHDLIPLLVDRFHLIAPDYPGMGYSEAPDPTVLRPTFDDVAMAIDGFIAQCAPGPPHLVHARHRWSDWTADRDGPSRPDRRPDFSEYDYISGRLEPRAPESLRAARRPRNPREPGRDRAIYNRGPRHVSSQEGRTPAGRPESGQLGDRRLCFLDRGESGLHVKVVDEPRDEHPALPGMERAFEGPAAENAHRRGRNDPLFMPAAAEFVKQVVPTAELRYFDGGHFVLDEYADAIAEAMIETFSR